MFVPGNPYQPGKLRTGDTSGLYYKHMMIINDDSSVIIKWSSKLIGTARGVIYDRHMFIVQATGATGLSSKYCNGLERLTSDKHYSLLSLLFSDK